MTDAQRQQQTDQAWEQHLAEMAATNNRRQAIIRRNWMLKRFEEQCGLCHYCGTAMIVMTSHDQRSHSHPSLRATADHVICRASGGPDTFENIVAACEGCNREKGTMSADAFLRLKWCLP